MKKNLLCHCGSSFALATTSVMDNLDALHCENCGGVLLDLNEYRQWRNKRLQQTSAAGTPVSDGIPVALSDSPGVRSCPACARFMSRYRAGVKPDFHIDRCSPCQLVWFDAGELQALVASGLQDQIDDLLSDGWQRRIKTADLQAGREDALRRKLGAERFEELKRIRAWLDTQPNRTELIGLLQAGW